jgi:hypothetical protein
MDVHERVFDGADYPTTAVEVEVNGMGPWCCGLVDP